MGERERSVPTPGSEPPCEEHGQLAAGGERNAPESRPPQEAQPPPEDHEAEPETLENPRRGKFGVAWAERRGPHGERIVFQAFYNDEGQVIGHRTWVNGNIAEDTSAPKHDEGQ